MRMSSAASRQVFTLEDVRPRRFEYLESLFPLSMAVAYRMVFMTELWRLAIVPRVNEKKKWLNTSAVNNETIEFQMQMVPVIALSEDIQTQMLDSYLTLEASQSQLFVSTWAHTLHAVAQEVAVVVEARNDSTLGYSAVSTEHCRVVDGKDWSQTKEAFTNRAFASQAMPNVASVAPRADISDPQFIQLFLLGARHADLVNAEKVSEVRLLSRFLTVRARENACFGLFANVLFDSPAMYDDAEQQQIGVLAMDQRPIVFLLEPSWPIYHWRFAWTAATRIFLMRLYYLLAQFQKGDMTFTESSTITTPSGHPIFEKTFAAGDLFLDWERDLAKQREEMFNLTDGTPLAFSKREISAGYADLTYYNFLQQFLLDKEYGKSISRCTVFDRYDQETTILRLEFLENTPRKTVQDANAFFIQGIEQAIQQVDTFYRTYRDTW